MAQRAHRGDRHDRHAADAAERGRLLHRRRHHPSAAAFRLRDEEDARIGRASMELEHIFRRQFHRVVRLLHGVQPFHVAQLPLSLRLSWPGIHADTVSEIPAVRMGGAEVSDEDGLRCKAVAHRVPALHLLFMGHHQPHLLLLPGADDPVSAAADIHRTVSAQRAACLLRPGPGRAGGGGGELLFRFGEPDCRHDLLLLQALASPQARLRPPCPHPQGGRMRGAGHSMRLGGADSRAASASGLASRIAQSRFVESGHGGRQAALARVSEGPRRTVLLPVPRLGMEEQRGKHSRVRTPPRPAHLHPQGPRMAEVDDRHFSRYLRHPPQRLVLALHRLLLHPLGLRAHPVPYPLHTVLY